jgi:hypothetical protein
LNVKAPTNPDWEERFHKLPVTLNF